MTYFETLSLYTQKDIDDYITKLFWTKSEKLNFNYFRQKWIDNHKEIFDYLNSRYEDSSSIYETLYRLKHHIDVRPTCVICGGRVNFVKRHGFSKHCSEKCSANDVNTKNKHKETCIKKYGVSSYTKTSMYLDDVKKTSIKKYGVDHPTKRDEYKKYLKERSLSLYGTESIFESDEFKEKSRKTCKEKYGSEFVVKTDFFKEKSRKTCKEKYGSEFYLNSSDCKEKTLKTQNVKKGYSGSKKEYELFLILQKTYGNVKREYFSEKYPYHCDFYIPSIDTFIEFNGMWVHNNHPFDINSKEDKNILNEWLEKAKTSKYYKRAIDIWTKSDVEKRTYAKEHNLRWIEGWSINEIMDKLHIIKIS